MKKYRLGLDVGTNSLGWSVLELDSGGDPCAIAAAGARIFAEGRDSKSKATLAATRREARSARRRRDRFKQRQKFLLDELTKAGLFPEIEAERRNLKKLEPLALRAAALTTRLEPWGVGRALFHLNQRRGFKSNRKDRSEEAVSGVVSKSARLLLQQMGLIGPEMSADQNKKLSLAEKQQARKREAETRRCAIQQLADRQDLSYGSFLYQRHRQNKPTRARPGAAGDGKLYDVYPTRELYEDEFCKIWEAQAGHHRQLMTKDVRQRVHRAIFHQRPLKPQKRGKCTYLSAEDRTFRAMPSFQRYRIYQEVNSLEWWDGYRNNKLRDHREARGAIVTLLEKVSTKKSQAPFSKMKNELKRWGIAEGEFKFNFETQKRKGLDGNQTSNLMQAEDCIGPAWHGWSLEKQDDFIDIILNGTPEQQARDRKRLENDDNSPPPDGVKDDEEVCRYLEERFGLSEYVADNCMNAPLKDDTANISCRAARLVLEKMQDGIIDMETGEIILPLQSDAASEVAKQVPEFVNPLRVKGDDGKYRLLDKLPYYGEAFRDGRHIIPGTGNPADDDKTCWGGVTNPTVHIALNQIRLLINELLKRFGHPDAIAIELGRELPAGADKRREIERGQKENQDKNENYDKTLHEFGQQLNADNRLRLFLWEELNEDPNGRCCPFSGKKIGIADLFSGSTEIEHLIPFSVSLDNSRANKVVCTRKANRDKGNRTPHDAFGDSPADYDWGQIAARAESLPDSKRWRFQPDALQIWQQGDGTDFTSRHLNDTRYIGRLAREYLENICHTDKIDVVTGRMTSLLRRHWGLNSVLDGPGSSRKNRDDHRHHAVDAIVVGMTNRSMLQKVATRARELEDVEIERGASLNWLFPRVDGRQSAIDPWEGFRGDVAKTVREIVVSHKVKRKKLQRRTTDGQLHNETAYGIVSGPDKNDVYEVVTRKPVSALEKLPDIEAIRDPQLRDEFRKAFLSAKANGEQPGTKAVQKAVQEIAHRKGIRRLRRTERLSVIPIADATGKPYKAYKGDSNWGIEIYALPPGHKQAGKWEGVVVSRFEANQSSFKPGQTRRPHPAASLVMRLQSNDCVEMEKDTGDKPKLFRLQKVSQSGQMAFAEIHEANVDNRYRDKDDPFKYLLVIPGALKKRNVRKVHISSAGRVSYEQRRAPRRRK